MGARLVKFDFCPKENEQIEAVIKVPEEKRSVIHGVVKDWNNAIVKDAVVKLFEVMGQGHNCKLTPITHTFTDDCGQFLFGPLCANKKYALKVWFDDVEIRELIITPKDEDPCEDECSRHYHPHGSHESCEPCNKGNSNVTREIRGDNKNHYVRKGYRGYVKEDLDEEDE